MRIMPGKKLQLLATTIRDVRPRQALIFLRGYLNRSRRIRHQNKEGILSPTNLDLELTSYCAKNCNGCPVPAAEKADKTTIGLDDLRRGISIGIRSGACHGALLGGETLSAATAPLIETILSENPRMPFFCCTNGHYIVSQNGNFSKLALHDNFSIVLSIDGFEATNDSLRYRGSYNDVVGAAKCLRGMRCLFGASITLRPQNISEATSDAFIAFLKSKGFKYVYFAYSRAGLYVEPSVFKVAAKKHGLFVYTRMHEDGLRYTSLYMKKNGEFCHDRLE